MPLGFFLDWSTFHLFLNKFLNTFSTPSDSSTLPFRLTYFTQINTESDRDQSEFQYSRILSGINLFCQTIAQLSLPCPYSDGCVVIFFPFHIFENKCPRDTDYLSSKTPTLAVFSYENCCGQSSMHHYKTESTNCNRLNEIQQRSQHGDDEIQFGSQASPSFDHTTDQRSGVGACTRPLDQEENSCNTKNQQAQDTDTHLPTFSIVPFDNEESYRHVQPREEITDSSLAIVPSETVTPLPPSTVQVDPNDTGEFPHVSMIGNSLTRISHQLVPLMGPVQLYSSVETFVADHQLQRGSCHFVIHCNPTSTQALLPLTSLPMVKKIYIYCPRDRLEEFDALSTRYPERVIVFQQQDTLILLVLWDLATFLKDLGRHYEAINQTELAQNRYRSAYRLRVVIQSEIRNQMQNITDNRLQ